MPEIKERPILFSAPMVRAILEGRKTVTRRALNAQSLKNIGYGVQLGECHELPSEGPLHPNSIGYYTDFCPFGHPGDRLWVRETHADIGCRLTYRADLDDGAHCKVAKWTPAIHMFRKHSRILLEITDVRLERLHDISDDQALAEGIYSDPAVNGMYTADGDNYTSKQDGPGRAFSHLWKSTGGDWAANPWVWLVEFKRVTP